VQLLEKLTELKNRVQVVRSETLEGWMNELSGVNQNLVELGQNLARLEQDLSRQRLRAPASGLVHALAVNSPGEVVEEGETVLRIVPEQRNLLAETRISPRDVGHITTGQAVKVKVSTFDYARFGTVPGTVESISPSSLTDPEGNVYFQVDVLLERDHVGENPEDNRLQPGMSVQADIVTGDKTLMEYLLKPIYASARGAFNER
jgi:HlyD family type I secretion membrane fusion protein